ncbi:MAG TPA: insulinase family protein [Kofleriaceae bacterium]|nr:insulinase family protein [Kofleriaceae bacterium]
MKRLLSLVLVATLACGGGSSKPPPSLPTMPVVPASADGTPTASPAPADPDDAPLPLWPEVKKGTLSNGLTYYILRHGKPEKRALLWLAVNAGSVQEDDDQRGLAHFDEHMAFNGTKRFPKNDIIKYLERIGMRFGADLNAYTTWDQTVYQLEVPSDSADYMTKGLDILRDWAGDVQYEPGEVDKERGVVKEEWRLGRGAGMRLFDKHSKVLYKGSRYADRITIGLPEILDKAPRDTLYRFYKDWYRPDLMAVIAVGDFDPAQIESEIKARFGDLKKPDKPRPRPAGGVPPAEGTRVSIETDKEASGTSVSIANLIAHRPEASKRDYRRLLMEQLYSMVLNERLDSLARKPEAPFLNAAGSISQSLRTVDSFSRFASAKQGKVEETLRALLTEVVRIEKHGITQTEFERAVTNMKRSTEDAADTLATRQSRQLTDEITRNFFEGEEMVGATAEKEMTLQILPTLTLAELNKLGQSYGGAEGRVILISGPEGKPLPNKDRVLAIVDEVNKAQVTPWEDAALQTALMDKAPTAGKVTKEKTIDKIGVTEWTLSNGVKVVVKPTDFEIDSVSIRGSSPGGEAMASDKDYPNAKWADEVAGLGGVGNFDVETLAKMLAGKQARASANIGEVTESIEAGGSAKDLETIFQLVNLRMTAPRKDERAFGVWKSNYAEQITNALRSPEFRYARESTLALYKGHLRRKPPEPKDIEVIDQDKALAFYKDRFGDASDFTFVIVGAVKLDELKPLVETYLGSLPAKGRKEKEKDLKIRKVGGVVKKEFKLGSEPKASVQLDFHGDYKWTRDNDRDMFILGQVTSILLREVMREDMGGVYGVGAGGYISRSPFQERGFSVRFGCDPARADELVKAVFTNNDRMKKDLSPEEQKSMQDALDRVKQTFLRTRETDLRRNGFWLGWLASSYRYGDDPTIILDTEAVTKRMTADNVKASAKKFFDAKTYYEAVMLPENAAAAPAPAPAPQPAPAQK